jgi:hypothetical protein
VPFLYKVALSFKVIVAFSRKASFASIKSIPVLVLIKKEAYNRAKGLVPRAPESI